MMDPKAIWEAAKKLALEAITEAFAKLPGTDGAAREEFAVQFVLSKVEAVDQLVPVVGVYMDLPLIDLGEKLIVTAAVKATVRLLVRQQFAAYEISRAVAA